MMTRLPQAVQSYEVKSKGVKNLVKRLEEPGFPAIITQDVYTCIRLGQRLVWRSCVLVTNYMHPLCTFTAPPPSPLPILAHLQDYGNSSHHCGRVLFISPRVLCNNLYPTTAVFVKTKKTYYLSTKGHTWFGVKSIRFLLSGRLSWWSDWLLYTHGTKKKLHMLRGRVILFIIWNNYQDFYGSGKVAYMDI